MRNDYRDYLMHYGVKGMKWRHHRTSSPSNLSEYEAQQRYAENQRRANNIANSLNSTTKMVQKSVPSKKQVAKEHPVKYGRHAVKKGITTAKYLRNKYSPDRKAARRRNEAVIKPWAASRNTMDVAKKTFSKGGAIRPVTKSGKKEKRRRARYQVDQTVKRALRTAYRRTTV